MAKPSNLATRLLTAAVVVPLLLALLFKGPPWGWLVLMLFASMVGAVELFGMTHRRDRLATVVGTLLTAAIVAGMWLRAAEPRLLLTAVLLLPFAAIVLTLARPGNMDSAALRVTGATFGPLWIGMGTGALALLRVQGGDEGPAYVIFAMTLAWMADTGGYFAGRFLGKHKLYEAVSPKKTIEGAVGSVVAATAAVVICKLLIIPSLPVIAAAALGLIGSCLGIMGDLGESLLKRSVGVKDSGGIVPGHGGILDRIDALLITAPLTLLYLLWLA